MNNQFTHSEFKRSWVLCGAPCSAGSSEPQLGVGASAAQGARPSVREKEREIDIQMYVHIYIYTSVLAYINRHKAAMYFMYLKGQGT